MYQITEKELKIAAKTFDEQTAKILEHLAQYKFAFIETLRRTKETKHKFDFRDLTISAFLHRTKKYHDINYFQQECVEYAKEIINDFDEEEYA